VQNNRAMRLWADNGRLFGGGAYGNNSYRVYDRQAESPAGFVDADNVSINLCRSRETIEFTCIG